MDHLFCRQDILASVPDCRDIMCHIFMIYKVQHKSMVTCCITNWCRYLFQCVSPLLTVCSQRDWQCPATTATWLAFVRTRHRYGHRPSSMRRSTTPRWPLTPIRRRWLTTSVLSTSLWLLTPAIPCHIPLPETVHAGKLRLPRIHLAIPSFILTL